MTISIRLDADTEAELRLRLREQQIPLSDFVRQALQEKLSNDKKALSAYEIGEGLFGKYSSGRDDLSSSRKAILNDKLKTKHHARAL